MNLHLRLYAENKAKEDMDDLMSAKGFRNVAIGSYWRGKVARFFAKILTVAVLPFRIHGGDTLLIQYPFKKYYPSLCRIARMKGAKTVTLIHDLGCFRRKKLTVEQEVKKLSHTDVLIVHNDAMKAFLLENGYKKPVITLDIFDYLSNIEPVSLPSHIENTSWDVVYAGGLAERKNMFLYDLDKALPDDCCWTLHIHGKGLNEQKAASWTHIIPRGFIKTDDFIHDSVGQFGLVWDGSSINECAGAWGEYLKINNPHKTSFYLRAGKPVIIWSEAALAPFVVREGVGITISSLTDLHDKLKTISAEDYEKMVERVQIIRERLAEGYYLSHSFEEATEQLCE